MTRYTTLQEELLDGPVSGKYAGNEKAVMYRIESKDEFKVLDNNCRGIIYKKNLYMVTKPNKFIHRDIINWLNRHKIINPPIKANDNSLYEKVNNLLLVAKYQNKLYLGESYNEDAINNYTEEIKKLLASISSLGIKTVGSSIKTVRGWG